MAIVTLTTPEALRPAVSAYNAGKLLEAERLCYAIIAVKQDFFEGLHLLAVIQTKLGREKDALASFERALTVRPDHAEVLNNRGVLLQELKRFNEALASYEKAISLKPDFADAFYNRGNTLRKLK